MKTQALTAAVMAVCLSAGNAFADTKDKLIKLDRKWGEATNREEVKSLLTENFMLLDEDGITYRKDLLDEMEKNPPPDEPYVAGGYEIRMIDDKVAVMIHSAGSGDEKYRSMHVWRKHDGKWKVAASATMEADD